MTTAPIHTRPMPFTVLIPSRLQSTRLPEKALADIGGVPMVVRVAQRALQSRASRVVVATDSRKIIEEAERHGIAALMTRSDHPSGSDRLAEAASLLGLDEEEIVVNVQGDEPLIDPALIDALAEKMTQAPSVPMATVAHPIHSLEDWCNPNVVKVVMDARDHALYFSRAPIPWKRGNRVAAPTDLPDPLPMRHVGIYGYRTRFLQEFPKLAPAPEEATEALEQLRVLWHGHPIIVHRATEAPPAGVDTQDDLDRVRALFA